MKFPFIFTSDKSFGFILGFSINLLLGLFDVIVCPISVTVSWDPQLLVLHWSDYLIFLLLFLIRFVYAWLVLPIENISIYHPYILVMMLMPHCLSIVVWYGVLFVWGFFITFCMLKIFHILGMVLLTPSLWNCFSGCKITNLLYIFSGKSSTFICVNLISWCWYFYCHDKHVVSPFAFFLTDNPLFYFFIVHIYLFSVS